MPSGQKQVLNLFTDLSKRKNIA